MDYISRGRGRPRKDGSDPISTEPTLVKQFTKTYKDGDGHKSVWTWDLDVNPNGPISVEEFYPEGTEEALSLNDVTGEHIPKTKRMYLNPANGKLVGYARGKMLNLVD